MTYLQIDSPEPEPAEYRRGEWNQFKVNITRSVFLTPPPPKRFAIPILCWLHLSLEGKGNGGVVARHAETGKGVEKLFEWLVLERHPILMHTVHTHSLVMSST